MPPWLSAFAAVLGVIVTAIGVFGWVGHQDDARNPSPSPAPHIILDSVVVSDTEVTGNGRFTAIDPSLDRVLFLAGPKTETVGTTYSAVEAVLAPDNQAGDLKNGDWEAVRPATTGEALRYWAVLWPRSAGATGNDDLRLHGPNSQFVIAASEPYDAP